MTGTAADADGVTADEIEGGGDVILVVDDDPDVRFVVRTTLEFADFEVMTAEDGTSGLELALTGKPDLILLDVMMPDTTGFEVVDQLRHDARVSDVPIILVTAKAQLRDKVTGLDHGADDYIAKPFDADELVARVRATLRRARTTRSVSPLTGLPANVRIEQELARRVAGGEPLALLYADLNYFKPYNDHYGFLRGDEAIRALADILRRAASRGGDEATFVGHIGGDDFVIVTVPERAEIVAQEIADRFDATVPDLYDEEDRDVGFIEVEDRAGIPHRYPQLSVSTGVVTNTDRAFDDHRELVQVATEMKNYAKRVSDGTSNYAVDRRTDDRPHV